MDQRNLGDRQGVRPMRRRRLACGFFRTGQPSVNSIPPRGTGLEEPKTVEFIAKLGNMGPLEPPMDKSVKTLYICRLNSSVLEQHIRERFSPYGEIKFIVFFFKRGVDCAYLTYTNRKAAEKAMLELSSWVDINGQNLKLLWGARNDASNQPPPNDVLGILSH